jgi:hypothetical protein
MSYPAARAVLERPPLNGTTLRLSHNASLGSISPGDTVDLPLAALALELEGVIEALLVRREWDCAECSRKSFVLLVAADLVAYDESHDFVCVEIRVDVGNLGIRLECDVLVLESAEVKHDFPTFGHGDVKLGSINRLRKKACIGTDNL